MKKSAVTILGLCALGLIGVGLERPSAAIEFSSKTNVGFNFSEVLSVNISGDIEINGLAAGQSKDSDTVEIVVRTNALGGYVLGATVGTNANRNSDLAYSVSSVTDKKFENIATDANLGNLSRDNTWGYKVSEDDSVWSNYNGLALIGGDQSILREKSEMPSGGSETTYFKIGAKASADIVPGDYTNSITFYAVTKAFVATLSTIATMQEMTPDVCTASSVGETAQLTDTRADKQVYTVKKLADNKCWMTENLRLGGSEAIALTSADTNITSDWTLPASGTANFTSSTGYTTAAVNANYKTKEQAASESSPAGKIGNYYNYCAASAGTYCYASGSAPEGTNAEHDICPKGWRMPTGGSSGEYQALYTAYSSNVANFQSALVTPLSGYFNSGSALFQGYYGYFWSSTFYGGDYMYYLSVNSSSVNPTNNYSRYYGISVRCVDQ